MPSPQDTRVLDAVLTAVLDYALRKPGTVAARRVVSANPRMVAGLAAATIAVGRPGLAVISNLPGVAAHTSGGLAAATPLRTFPDHEVAYEIPGTRTSPPT
ncbi:hypothetical protein AB0D91_40440 [Streptomyces canus]|uniref:hypothetical protein n=1 Tax=Streptomyces canus TaxID=58343 RepID=UPI0033D31AE2